MKTKEELNAIKEEVETVSRKLHELTEEELKYIAGGDSEYKYYMHIKRLIECGYDVNARNYYKSYAEEFPEQLRRLLRRQFQDKFGYPIE